MGREMVLLVAATAAASAALTLWMRRIALRSNLLDVPNERSSHDRAVPRGGGVAIVVSVTAALLVLLLIGRVDPKPTLALCIGGLAVAAGGLLDDRMSLRASTRLAIQTAAALGAIAYLGGLPPLRVGQHLVTLGAAGYLLGALAIVWSVNLFNFMDGIDGIAASEAAFVAVAGAVLGMLTNTPPTIAIAALVFGAACCGFLLWNWPPASIFMGDVGSGYLGYFIAVLAVGAMHKDPAAGWAWLILCGVFVLDATVTLLRRLLRGERVLQAHRGHAYQRLARRWGSHRKVTVAILTVNVLWLLPCAVFATLRPEDAARAALIALAPLIVLAVVAGSGRREN